MVRLAWMVVVAGLGCGPNVNPGEPGSTTDAEEETTTGSPTSADPTVVSTSSTTTADPSLPSTVTTVDPDGSATVVETDGVTDCPGGGGLGSLGDACIAHPDCASGVCRRFSDAPPDPAAVCGDAPADCSTVITATVWRMPPGPPGLSGVPVRILEGADALLDPFGAAPLLATESDAAGRIDGATDGPVTAQIAIVAVAGGDMTYFPTVTGVAWDLSPGVYEVGAPVHDVWALPEATRVSFDTALQADPTIPADLLPLGEQGGTVGVVRDAGGSPIAGAIVQPVAPDSDAIVRYVRDDGNVDTTATANSGVFIVLSASAGEEFQAVLDGEPVAVGEAASADGVVFALALTAV